MEIVKPDYSEYRYQRIDGKPCIVDRKGVRFASGVGETDACVVLRSTLAHIPKDQRLRLLCCAVADGVCLKYYPSLRNLLANR